MLRRKPVVKEVETHTWSIVDSRLPNHENVPRSRCNVNPERERTNVSRRATIRDVAEAAGVSKATVSRVLAGNYPVSQETADRVHHAVQRLSYTASSRARSLATGRSNAVAVVVSEPLDTFFADPTFARIVQGVSDFLSHTEVVPVLLTTTTKVEQRKALRLITNQTVDAVIHLSPWSDEGLLDSLLNQQVPVVVCGQDERFERRGRFSFVYSDDRLGAAQAARHLRERGAQSPVAILGVPGQPAASDRLEGYRQVFPGLEDHRTAWGGWSEADGASAMQDFLRSGITFDAVMAASDRIARGALSVLSRAGRQVPADVLVVGYDDHPSATGLSPHLSTVSQPMHAQGETACRLAQEMVEGRPPRTVVLPTTLHVRETS